MFKLNKSTHMLILMTFTIVFVVVYMYYTIKDVKKMYAEVKKHEQEIQNLTKLEHEVKEMKGVIGMVMSGGMIAPVPPEQFMMAAQHVPVAPAPASKFPNSRPPPQSQQSQSVIADDVSVATEDIKKLVDDDDAEDNTQDIIEEFADEAPKHESVSVNEVTSDVSAQGGDFTEEQLKKMKFDDLKEIAKKKNISIKGTRDSLITRIMSEKNVS